MILPQLRERTADLHRRVEAAVDLPARLGSAAAYAGLLGRLHGFYAPVEDRLAADDALPALLPDLAARRKAHLLRADLLALGHPAAAVDAAPRCPDLPATGGAAAALGCFYVLEGATLGGRVVCREARARLGLEPGRGCSFFASYGDRVGGMWRGFCAALERYAAAAPALHGRIVAAAGETFAALERWVAGGATGD